jgi:hypothetical protein
MSYTNDTEAFCLANTYNLVPPRITQPVRSKNLDSGKYEPDHTPEADSRCMVLAHWIDHTNIIVQYEPGSLEFE